MLRHAHSYQYYLKRFIQLAFLLIQKIWKVHNIQVYFNAQS